MGTVAHILRSAIDLTIAPLDGLGIFVTLTVHGLVTALLILVVVRWTTPAGWIDRARAQIAAAIYEVRLFLDSPARVLKAQGRLLGYTGVYLAALAPALIVMTVPMGLYYLQLDLRYGFEPLPLKTPVVAEVRVAGGVDDVSVDPGGWGHVSAPLVRDPAHGRVYVRLEIDRPGVHQLVVRAGDERAEKRVAAEHHAIASPVRARGWDMWWAETDEKPLPGPRIQRVALDQRGHTQDVLGMPWWLYWLLVATALALALRKPFRVTL